MSKVKEAVEANLKACKTAASEGEPDKALKYAQAAATCSTSTVVKVMDGTAHY